MASTSLQRLISGGTPALDEKSATKKAVWEKFNDHERLDEIM